MSRAIGREARAAARRASASDMAHAAIADTLPWLVTHQPGPDDAEAQILDLFHTLKARARGMEAAREATDALHAVVDAWNAANSEAPLAAPPAVTPIRSRNPGWSLSRLDRLAKWRPWGAALGRRLAVPASALAADEAAGLVLAAAIRHGGLGDPVFLAVLARWLAAPDSPLKSAEGLPLWLDLKARRREAETDDAPAAPGLLSRVRVVSGEDACGAYALRRWYVDPHSLAALVHFFAVPCDAAGRERIAQAAESRNGLIGLIRAGIDPEGGLGKPPGLTHLIDGAFAELEAESRGMNSALSGIARGRLRWASPTPESWEATFARPGAEDDAGLPDLERDIEDAVPDPGDADEEEDDDALARREARAFSALHALMSDGASRRRGLATDEVRLTRDAFVRRLDAARTETGWWPSAALLLFDWYRDLAEQLEPASVRRYHSALTDRLLDCAGDLAFETAGADALAQVFAEVLEDDPRSDRERALARKLLRRLHRWGIEDERWQLPEVDPELFVGAEDGAGVFRIAPRILSAAAFAGARTLVRGHPDLDLDGRLAVEAAMILQRRAGLRIGEVCKLQLADLEPDMEDPALIIRPNRFGSNKSRAARRMIRPFSLANAEETETLRRWVLRRRMVGGEGPLIGLVTPAGIARIASGSLGALIADVLRRSSGLEDVPDHALRHCALCDLDLALAWARAPQPHPLLARGLLLQRLSGLTEAEAGRAAEAVCPTVRRRDSLGALAVQAGHSSPATSVTSYLHLWGLRIFEAVAAHMPQVEYDRLCSALADHIVRVETVLGAPEDGDADLSPGAAFDPVDLLAGLEALESGMACADAAIAARVPEERLDAARITAEALATLKTRKGALRLFPDRAKGRLAPPPPRSQAELREGRALFREFWAVREERRSDVIWWCAVNLMRATRTNAGLRLTVVDEIRRWRAIVDRLSPRRWALHLEGPPDALERADWEAACPPGTIWRTKKGTRSIAAIARLPRPESESPETGLRRLSPDYASGAPVYAAHGLAIALALTPRALALSLDAQGDYAR